MAQVKNKSKKSEVEETIGELIRQKFIQNNIVLSFEAYNSLRVIEKEDEH